MTSSLIQIDLWHLVRQKLGTKGKYLPHWIVRPLERLVRQKEMNGMLRTLYPMRGADFCRGVMKELGIHLKVCNKHEMPVDSRCIFVCNHPLGGLDGICIIAWLSELYGKRVHVVVNDLLASVEPLTENFLPVNKFGAQNRCNVSIIDEALAADEPVVVFPAGLVSRLQPDGSIHDLKWHKSFISMAVRSQRNVVPMFFDGCNTGLFYRMGKLRKRFRIRINLEQLLLPREVFLSRGCTFRIICGTPVAWENLHCGAGAETDAGRICDAVYALAALNPIQIKEEIWT